MRIILTALLLAAIPTGVLADTRLFLVVSGVAPVPLATFQNPAGAGANSIQQCISSIAAARRSAATVTGAAVNVSLVCVSTTPN